MMKNDDPAYQQYSIEYILLRHVMQGIYPAIRGNSGLFSVYCCHELIDLSLTFI